MARWSCTARGRSRGWGRRADCRLFPLKKEPFNCPNYSVAVDAKPQTSVAAFLLGKKCGLRKTLQDLHKAWFSGMGDGFLG